MIAQLALQTDLAVINAANGIVHFDNSNQVSAGTINRIVVQAMPRLPHTYGKDTSEVIMFKCDVKVTVYLVENSPTILDTYVAAIQAACTGSAPASIVTLATSLFGVARGFRWFYTDEAGREDTDNERQASQTWCAVFGAP